MISIIVPIYNVELYLNNCVDSILNQTFSDIEIILVDDGSPDRSGEICEEYAVTDKRVRVFHIDNRGLSGARNYGIQRARGEYIGFVDSDDWIEPDMFEVLLSRLVDTNSEISVCGISYECNETVVKVRNFGSVVYQGSQVLEALVNDDINNVAWNKLYKRSLFEEVKFPEGKYYEDIAIMHRVFNQCERVSTVDGLMYHYRQRRGSISREHTGKHLFDKIDGYLDRYYYLKAEYPDLFDKHREDITRYVADSICMLWRWWHGCNQLDKLGYNARIEGLKRFIKESIPLFGYKSWPIYLKVSSLFMHSSSNLSFALLYGINQVFRLLFPKESNVV